MGVDQKRVGELKTPCAKGFCKQCNMQNLRMLGLSELSPNRAFFTLIFF